MINNLISIIKDTSIYAIGSLLTKGINFIAIVFYTHLLTQVQVGVYGYLVVILGFLNTFALLGADNAFARYYFEYKIFKDKQVLTSSLFIFLFLWAITLIFPMLFFTHRVSFLLLGTQKYSSTIFLALVSLPLQLLSSMSNQTLRNQFKTKQFIKYNFVTTFIMVLISIISIKFFKLGVDSIFLGIIVANIIVLPFRLISIKELLVFSINWDVIKVALSYGLPFVPTSIAYWVFGSADRVMLKSMSTLKSVGIYTVAISISSVMALMANAIGQAWSPHAVKVFEKNEEEARVLYEKFFNVLVAIVIIVVFVAAMVGQEMINIVFSKKYSGVFLPMLMLLVGLGFQITTQVTAIGISLKKKSVYFFYVTIFVAMFNICMNYILIPKYSELGASIATMLSYFVLTFIYVYISNKLFVVHYNKKFLIIGFGSLILIFFLIYFPLYVKISLLLIVFAGLFYKRKSILEVF